MACHWLLFSVCQLDLLSHYEIIWILLFLWTRRRILAYCYSRWYTTKRVVERRGAKFAKQCAVPGYVAPAILHILEWLKFSFNNQNAWSCTRVKHLFNMISYEYFSMRCRCIGWELDMVKCVSDTLYCSSIQSLYLKPVSHAVVESVINTCSSHCSVLSGSSSHTLTNCSSAVFPKPQSTNGALHVCLHLSSSAKSSRYKK